MIRFLNKKNALALMMLCLFSILRPAEANAQSNDLEPLVLQLRWDHQFQFAGYYAAQWMGFYEEEGITTEIRTAFNGGKILDAATEVDQGRAQFGVGAADILIAQDQGMKLSLVASFFQRSAVAYYTLQSTPVNSVYDLSRLKMARRKNDLLDIELQALFLNEGIHPFSSINADVPRDFTVDDLTSNRYQLVPGYLGKIPYQAEISGVPLRAITPIQYGIDFYGDSLFTSYGMAKTNPELVERFRRASVKGWSYALEHPDEIADKIAQMVHNGEHPELTLEYLEDFNRYQADRVLELTHYPIVEIGNINPYRWKSMAATLKKLGIIKALPDLDTMIFDYRTVNLARIKQSGKTAAVGFSLLLIATILLFIYHLNRRNYMLRQEIQFRKSAENLLKEELEDNRRKEAIILYQARMAAMGEMVGNIAHQWRQPLNTLRLIISNLQDIPVSTDSDRLYAEGAYAKAHHLIEKMSVTIDDFRYFSRPNSEPTEFDLINTVKIAAELLDEQLQMHDITLQINAPTSPTLTGMDNHLSHAIFNILSNADQALMHFTPLNMARRSIIVDISSDAANVEILISDNGPGISPEHANRIFDIYYTSKLQEGGTGLGLYMAKTIVENSFHGTIQLLNTAVGASFLIRIPKLMEAAHEHR